MPSKKKKKPLSQKQKKRLKEQQERMWDFIITYTDVTMAEADGEYDIVKELMDADPALGEHSWVIRTRMTITSPLGEGHMTLNLYHDRRIYIVEYQGAQADMYYNPDIRCLTQWAQGAGWNIPQPTPDVIKDNPKFWKHMWETLLIDSDYLDTQYGERQSLAMRTEQQEEEWEEDE